MGKNLHFYVLNDETDGNGRLLDPYQDGMITIKLGKKKGDAITGEIPLPLNSLFVPRKCPNGKDAHITWKFCPWTGEPLEK